MSGPRFPYVKEFTQAERDWAMERAFAHLKRNMNKRSHKESSAADLYIEYHHILGKMTFSEFTGLDPEEVWEKYTKAVRYNFETPKWRIKVAWRGKVHDPLYINHHHLANIHANVYVQVVGDDKRMELTGWGYTEDFWGPIGFEYYPKSGPTRAIAQDDLRPFGLLRKLLK